MGLDKAADGAYSADKGRIASGNKESRWNWIPFSLPFQAFVILLATALEYETLERTLSVFFPLLSVSLIRTLLKVVRDKERFHFRDGGGISRGYFACKHDRWKMFPRESAQVAAKYSMCKCTWQTQEKKIPRPPAWELPYSVPLQVHDISLYFDDVSWQAQVSQFDQHRVHLSPTGSWLQTTTDCQSWFSNSTPSPGDSWKYIKVYIIYNRFLFLLFTSWNMVQTGSGPSGPGYTYSVIFHRVWNISSSASGFLLSHNLARHSYLDDFLISSKLYSPLIIQISARINNCCFV